MTKKLYVLSDHWVETNLHVWCINEIDGATSTAVVLGFPKGFRCYENDLRNGPILTVF